MTIIKIIGGSVVYPIFNTSGRAFTDKVLTVATGGLLGSNKTGQIEITALSDLNLEIHAGERVGIVGHNGAGKSSLLKLIAGVYEPTSGQILREGKVGALTDIHLGVNPDATGKENIFLRGNLLGLSKKEINSKLVAITEFTEMGDFLNLPVRTYSTGMNLRLAFAVATAVEADILVMDEWLSVGDEAFQNKAEERLNAMVDASEILVIASHSRELLENICTRIIWLEHGSVKADGSPSQILKNYFG